MPELSSIINRIFKLKSSDDFNALALEIFQYQYKNNKIYHSFVDYLVSDVNEITSFKQIPFMPIEFFKRHKVVSGNKETEIIFTSSGTTGMSTSKHYVNDIQVYTRSFRESFKLFFGDIKEYTILALLPSYLEKGGSSLVFMANQLINDSNNPASGFYLDELSKLNYILTSLRDKKQKVILLGVTYALLDLAERFPLDFPDLILMETGGMKGKRKEIIREELHEILINGFGVKKVYSEYGMTELLSQAYSYGDGIFNCPPWMKILVRDVNDPLKIIDYGRSGGINIIDLANVNSCSFIATQDLGKLNPDDSFEILGRFDASDVRGCNLMVG